MLGELGCTDVKTYIQSGNAVFSTALDAATLRAGVERSIAHYMNRPVATTLRTQQELRAIVEANPFMDHTNEPNKLCVTFLAQPLTDAEGAPLRAKDWTPEAFQIVQREIYTWHPEGQGKSKLALALQKLKVPVATTRNWNTVQKLLELMVAS